METAFVFEYQYEGKTPFYTGYTLSAVIITDDLYQAMTTFTQRYKHEGVRVVKLYKISFTMDGGVVQ